MTLELQDAVGRQYPLVATAKFTYEDLTSGTAAKALGLPGNARVIGGEITITEAFNSATSDVADVGDDADVDRYAAAVNIAATGRTALTLTGYKYATPNTVDIIWTGAGAAPTAGEGYIEVMYVLEDRANEVQPV